MPRTIVHVGRKIKVAIEEEPLPGGGVARRDIIMHPGAVAVLPLVDDRHVCLLRNYRPAVGDTLWEIPAGTLEPNEPLEIAAARELAEETGYRAAELVPLRGYLPSPGCLDEVTHLFAARGLTPGAMALEPCEKIEPVTVEWGQAMAWVLDGTIRDMKTALALLLWERRR